jgi:hypothetical protein
MAKSLDELEREKVEKEIAKLGREEKEEEREARARTSFFDRDAIVRAVKKHTMLIILVLIIMILPGFFLYIDYTGHTGLFSYQEASFYDPILSSVGSFFAPLGHLLASYWACIGTPVLCQGFQNTNTTVVVYPTFSSFLTTTPAANPQTVFLIQNGANSGQLFYSVTNNANIPLGMDTGNPILFNASCGSLDNPAGVMVCQNTVSLSPGIPPNVLNNVQSDYRLVSSIFPGETIENQTVISASCPVNPQITLPSIADVLLNFTIKNYSAASISPIEFISNSFDEQLLSSQQGLVPSEPSVTFVSPGPLQIALGTSEPQPIITDTGNVPINIQITNNGPGSYIINSLIIYVPKSLWPSNPYPAGAQGGWQCSDVADIPSLASLREIDFVFPTSGYWACKTTISSSAIEVSGIQIILPNVPGLGGMHFNTVPILTYLNYNYIQQMEMPFVLRPEAGTCASS